MPQLSTGFVIAGAYADKLRRVLFAQLRDAIKRGEIDNKTVAQRAGELNRLLFEILVNKLKIDKGDVVRIRIEYDVKDGDIVWKLDTLRIEAFRRIPDEEIEKVVKESIGKKEEILAREVTEEERAWTEAREREVEREVQRRAEKAREAARREMEAEKAAKAAEARAEAAAAAAKLRSIKDIGVEIADAVFYGHTAKGELIAVLKNPQEDNIGMAIVEPVNGGSRATIILIKGKKEAYKATIPLDKPADELEEDPKPLIDAANNAKYVEIPRSEAERIIREKMEELV